MTNDLNTKIDNIIWHAETNRNVLGDTRILNEILNSLKNIRKELN